MFMMLLKQLASDDASDAAKYHHECTDALVMPTTSPLSKALAKAALANAMAKASGKALTTIVILFTADSINARLAI